MDIVYAKGGVTAAEVNASLPDAPSYSAIRALLRILEEKGFLHHRKDGPRYVYESTEPPEHTRSSALKRMVEIFFVGSAANAVAALVDEEKLSPEELDRIEKVIKNARIHGRAKQ